jgi:sigma-B regulation protein RsbU (phosphoserine phosphatase)
MLHENEERLQLALEAGRMGTWDWNVRTGKVEWSATLEAIHGLPAASFPGTYAAFLEEIHPDDRAAVVRSITRALEEVAEHRVEYRICWHDGSVHWLEGRGRLFRDPTGQPLHMIGVCTDITERKRAELALVESEQRYRRLLASVSDYIFTVRLEEGRPVETVHGPGCEGVTGYPPSAFAAEPFLWFHMIAPEDREAVSGQIEKILAGDPVAPFEHRIIHRDGSIRWIRHSPVAHLDERGRVTAYDGLITDVTERRNAEEASWRSLGLLRAVIEGTTDAVFVKDRQGRYLMINTAGARLLGQTVEDVIGKDDTELFSPATASAIMEGDLRVMATGVVQTYEDVGTAAGVTRTYLSTKGPYRDLQGNVIGLIGISRDITDRKLAEQRLREAEQSLHDRHAELRLAQQIQQGLLPRTAPSLRGFEMAGASQPAQETGGDYFDFIPTVNGLCVAIGDASGHGIPAAMLMAETRAYLRALSLSHTDVGQILTLVNLHLVADIERDWFVTLFLAYIDPQTRTLVYCSAGHCSAFILDHRGKLKTTLRSTATPLGIDMVADYSTTAPVQPEVGDLIFLFTDGIVEAFPPDRTPFGIERALDFLRSHRHLPAQEIVDGLLQAVRDYCGVAPLDDMTAVVLKVVSGESQKRSC